MGFASGGSLNYFRDLFFSVFSFRGHVGLGFPCEVECHKRWLASSE